MQIRRWAALLLLTIGGTGAAMSHARADQADDLVVMTYNVRYASDTPPNSWPQRLPVTVAMIEEYQPDVIGTQETLYRQAKDLDRELPGYGWIGLGREGGSRGEMMAIFYRHERLEPLEFDHYWLSDTPEVIGSTTWGNRNRRMVTWVRFRDLATKQELFVVNTHFDHEIAEAREKSAALLRERIALLDPALPLIVTGDFNAPAERGAVYETLVGDGTLVDTWTAAEMRGELIGTFHNYRGPVPGGIRIDWILTRGPVTSLETEVVTYEQDGQYPSDHFPVLARLRLGGSE